MSRPVDPGRPGDVGMAAEPPLRERAQRHDREPLGDGVVDGRSYELASNAAAREPLGNLRMDEEELIVVAPEHQLGRPLGEHELEARHRSSRTTVPGMQVETAPLASVFPTSERIRRCVRAEKIGGAHQ